MKRKKNPRPEVYEANKIIGNRIRKLRKAEKISASTLGKVLDVTSQQIFHYESGVHSLKAIDLFVIAKTLNRPVSYFFLEIE
jgi:transcriptional regulator with XRE-family HTH domain